MIAAGSFIFVSTRIGLPVCSAQAMVRGMRGIVITLGGIGAVNWKLVGLLTMSWTYVPFLAVACLLTIIK
jgi:phosphate/sulfate permease